MSECCNETDTADTYIQRREIMQDMEQIYEKYMPQVYKYLFSLCHDTHLTEELTQETFFRQ